MLLVGPAIQGSTPTLDQRPSEHTRLLACSSGSSQPTGYNAAVHAQNVSISGGLISSAGRDVNNHTHFHEVPNPQKRQVDLLAELEAIDNFRGIQQDTLRKATPKTGEWIFACDFFPIWRDPKSGFNTLWGSGIREFGFPLPHKTY